MSVGKNAIPALLEANEKFMDLALKRLRKQTGGAEPKLGDLKDLFQHFGMIPMANNDDADNNQVYTRGEGVGIIPKIGGSNNPLK
jgi:hypothetical protein